MKANCKSLEKFRIPDREVEGQTEIIRQVSSDDIAARFGLEKNNFWRVLADMVPWGMCDDLFDCRMDEEGNFTRPRVQVDGRPRIPATTQLAVCMVKTITGLSDRALVKAIKDTPSLQYFIFLERPLKVVGDEKEEPFSFQSISNFRKSFHADAVSQLIDKCISSDALLPFITVDQNGETVFELPSDPAERAKAVHDRVIGMIRGSEAFNPLVSSSDAGRKDPAPEAPEQPATEDQDDAGQEQLSLDLPGEKNAATQASLNAALDLIPTLWKTAGTPPADDGSQTAVPAEEAETHDQNPPEDAKEEKVSPPRRSRPPAPLMMFQFATPETVADVAVLMGKSADDLMKLDVLEYIEELTGLVSDQDKLLKSDPRGGAIVLAAMFALAAGLSQKLKTKYQRERYADVMEACRHLASFFIHRGEAAIDATVFPADIRFPMDVSTLNQAREKIEKAVNIVWEKLPASVTEEIGEMLPYTWREAHSRFLDISKNKKPTEDDIRAGVKYQLDYIDAAGEQLVKLSKMYKTLYNAEIKLPDYLSKDLETVKIIYKQQKEMYENRTHRCDHRIVSLSQPYVRPIQRGKRPQKTEFGMKVHLMNVGHDTILLRTSWENYNEGCDMPLAILRYFQIYRCLPEAILADTIYQTGPGKALCALLGIRCTGRRLGAKEKEIQTWAQKVQEYKDMCARVIIEGRNGTIKGSYGMDRIACRSDEAQKSSAASAVLCMNLAQEVNRTIEARREAAKKSRIRAC